MVGARPRFYGLSGTVFSVQALVQEAAGVPGLSRRLPWSIRRAGDPGPSIAFTTVTDSAGFQRLEPEWRMLHAKAPPSRFFQSFDWCWRAWECVASGLGRRLCILIGRSEERVVLIWPLMIAGCYLRVLGTDLFEFHDMLVEPGEWRELWLEAAFRQLHHLGGEALLLRELRADSELAQFLRHSRRRRWTRSVLRTRILHLDRYPDWNAYVASLSKQLMADQRRQWRRLAQLSSPARFELVQPWGDKLELIRWIIARKVEWLHARRSSESLFETDRYRTFLEIAAEDFHHQAKTFVFRLTSGDDILSALLGFENEGYFIFFMFSYNAAWSRFSPSRLILERTIEWCRENGMHSFDMLIGEEDYKSVWADDEMRVEDHLIPLTLQGRAMAAWHTGGVNRIAWQRWSEIARRYMPTRLHNAIGSRLSANAELLRQMRQVR